MHKADLAELLFSMVTTRERAVSLVGDLLETTETGGAWRFWFLVACTAVRQLWRQMAAAPFGMAGAAVRGLFVAFGVSALALLVIAVPLEILLTAFHQHLPVSVGQLLNSFLVDLLVPFQVGRWMRDATPDVRWREV